MDDSSHSTVESSVLSPLKCENVQGGSLVREVYIYREDIVRSGKNEELTGIVLEVSGDSDSDAHLSESSDIEDDESKPADNDDCSRDSGASILNESPSEVQVRVMWINGSEKTENHSDLTVIDRDLLHGDIVASVSDPTGQLGLIVNVNMSVDLLASDGEMIKNVSSKDLKRIRDFTAGDYVVYGPWLGRVDDVLDNVTVQFDDGSICKVMKTELEKLKPVSKSLVPDSSFPYYPGQRVKAVSASVLKSSRWLLGSWKSSNLEGTVTNVQAASIFVSWIASASAGASDSSAGVPSEEQNPKNLTLLSCFANSEWQFGDWCLLPPTNSRLSSSNDNVLMKDVDDSASIIASCQDDSSHVNSNSIPGASSDIVSSLSKEYAKESAASRKKLRKVFLRREKKLHKREESSQKAFFVASTTTQVDVVWQDGTKEFSIEAKSLIPIHNPGEHEFFPEQYVTEEASHEGDDLHQVKRIGIVKSINSKERTACLRWLKPVSRPEDLMEFDNEEMVSVYELVEHQDYDYCYGDLVVRLSPPSVSSDRSNLDEDAENERLNDECDEVFSSLSWVGHVTGLHDGGIEVTWADGMISKVGPQSIYVVGREDGESFTGGSEVSEDGASWETFEENDRTDIDLAHEDDDHQPSMDVKKEDRPVIPSDQSNPGRKEDIISPSDQDALVNIVSHDHLTSHESTHVRDKELDHQDTQDYEGDGIDISLSLAAGALLKLRHSLDDDDDDDGDTRAVMDVGGSHKISHVDDQGPCSFKHFDIAKDPLDHHFLNGAGQSLWGRKWSKKIQKEWSILDKNLPDAIFVRAFEERMDLLRAVIVGACGTPYQDGLFFFDFFLPPEYPQVPPLAYYHSGGLRINPNLYEEGKVCLSLLNTWTGKGNEVWDPNSSSILQVLVSIQGLVLNSRPYFNEAGYEKQVGTAEGEKNAYPYNENTYLLNLRSMLYVLRRPPMHFEDFVKDHFRNRGSYILKACDAYMNGCPVGSLTKDACLTTKRSDEQSSVGFKLMLAKIIPKLFAALKEIGAQCGEFEHLCRS